MKRTGFGRPRAYMGAHMTDKDVEDEYLLEQSDDKLGLFLLTGNGLDVRACKRYGERRIITWNRPPTEEQKALAAELLGAICFHSV